MVRAELRRYDPGDAVLESEWYAARIGGELGPEAQRRRSAVYADTPSTTHLDHLGRAFRWRRVTAG